MKEDQDWTEWLIYMAFWMQTRLEIWIVGDLQAGSTSLVHRDKGTNDPPMAIVEEEIPTTSIIIMSASLPYTITNPHHPPRISHSTPSGVCISDW
jgi:hypothetical protein